MNMSSAALMNSGISHYSAGRISEAEKACQSVLALEPNHAKAHLFLGLIAESAGDIKVAIDFFQRALEKNPKSNQTWCHYIDALIQIRDYGLAKKSIKKAKKNGLSKQNIKSLQSKIYTPATHQGPLRFT